jgi:hypothetical protein
MNLSQMQALVNYRRRDTTESFVSNDEILDYLKEGNRKINKDNQYEWRKTAVDFSYVDGSHRYALSAIAADFDEAINVFYSPSYYFTFVKPEDFMRLSGYNNNLVALDGSDILVSNSFGTSTLTLNYYSTYTAKTSGGSWISNLSATTDEPLMPELKQDVLVDFASARCFQKEGLNDDYSIAIADFKDALKKLDAEAPSRRRRYHTVFRNTRKINGSGVADKEDVINQL